MRKRALSSGESCLAVWLSLCATVCCSHFWAIDTRVHMLACNHIPHLLPRFSSPSFMRHRCAPLGAAFDLCAVQLRVWCRLLPACTYVHHGTAWSCQVGGRVRRPSKAGLHKSKHSEPKNKARGGCKSKKQARVCSTGKGAQLAPTHHSAPARTHKSASPSAKQKPSHERATPSVAPTHTQKAEGTYLSRSPPCAWAAGLIHLPT